ncbi:MAG: CAP domain-containing protein [Planctomycetota bacterium]
MALILAPAPAQQQPDPAPEAIELPFLEEAAKALDVYATLSFKNGFPRRARELWIEVISQYDRDDAVAREQLGFVAVGTAWQPKPGFEYPDEDEPNTKNAKMLEGRWRAVCKRLGDGHRELAQKLLEAGNTERAEYHYKRALRFQPDDGKAQQSLGVKTVEGITGTDLELELLRRSRMLERLVTQLTDTTYDVSDSEAREPRLDKADVAYTAVQSEHFTVFGDWDPELLKEAAQWAERSYAFCTEAFAGYDSWQNAPVLTPKFAFFQERETWAKVVRANAGAVGEIEFILANTSACAAGGQGPQAMWLAGQRSIDVVFDYSARKVAEQFSRLGRDALVEGVGHAVVGLFFGRNLIMSVGLEKEEGTAVARDRSRFQLPDLETWKDLAREIAFERATAPAAHLPLITSAEFTSEERIKAWSFCDYLLRRDPSLMTSLDRAAASARNDFDVMAAFQELTRLSLRTVEDDWRWFYTGDSAALQAIRDKVTPMQAVSKDAPRWLDELNRLRREHQQKDIGWSADFSGACKDHAEYLKQNRGERGYGREDTQDPNLRGFSNVGRLFAQSAVVSTEEKDPKKAIAAWMYLPGYRDVVMNTTLETVGAYADGPILVMDVMRGRKLTERMTSRHFPYSNDGNRKNHFRGTVPSSVELKLLGPDIERLFERNGQGNKKEVGFPLTAHYFGGDPGKVTCTVTCAGEEVPGVLVQSNTGSRRVAAPGMWTFYPFDPLPKGKEITIHWETKRDPVTVIFQTT